LFGVNVQYLTMIPSLGSILYLEAEKNRQESFPTAS